MQERTMPVVISMLRGVNVGAHNRIKMDALCAIYKALKLEGARTYVQSGNVIFKSKEANLEESNLASLSVKIQKAIERKAGVCCEVILRTPEEMRRVIASNPFSTRREIDPAKLLVDFLAEEPTAEGKAKLGAIQPDPEELHLIGRELYIYFPEGAGRSKLQWGALEKKLGTPGTARNWNSVTRILAMAEEIEGEE
jgi:uncharacterized protein (DUF1697 family)